MSDTNPKRCVIYTRKSSEQMSFAQFEREMTADRIRDKMAATRKRGMWTGGVVPYGYRNVDRKLVVVPEAAEQVLFVYRKYLECRSFLETKAGVSPEREARAA